MILSLLIYNLQSEDWINTYYMLNMLKGFLNARRPPKVSNEMKCTDEKMTWNTQDMNLSSYVPRANEKMTWNTQDINLSSYVPKANVDHTISGQGTLDHLATITRFIRGSMMLYTISAHFTIDSIMCAGTQECVNG